MKHLLAKSYNKSEYPVTPPDYALLIQHSRDVATACDALAQTVGPLALLNAGFDEDLASFRLHLRAIGWMQDLGKVSSHFQEMVNGAFQITQLIRHETISGLLMLSRDLPFNSWLTEKFSEEDLLSIVWSAMGHHRKFDRFTNPTPTTALTVAVSHPDFLTILEEMGKDLNLSAAPVLERDLIIAQARRDKGDIGAREALHDFKTSSKTKKDCSRAIQQSANSPYSRDSELLPTLLPVPSHLKVNPQINIRCETSCRIASE